MSALPPPPPAYPPMQAPQPAAGRVHSSSKPPHPSSQRPHGSHRSHSHHSGHRKPEDAHRSSQPGSGHRREKEKEKEKDAASLATAAQSAALDSRLRRDTPFLATLRFKNDLPEVPGDPKLLISQPAPDKLGAFALTSLEKEAKRELYLPPDLGIPLTLLDTERYVAPLPDAKPPMDAADYALLGGEEEVKALMSVNPAALVRAATSNAPRRGAALRSKAEVSWLMRTTYIAQDSDVVRRQGIREKEAKALKEAVEGGAEDAEMFDSREAQVAAIEASFAAARAPPVHHTKPGMRAVEVMEVLPDWEWWGHKYLLAHFDSDPTQEVEALARIPDEAARGKVAARSMLKGFKLDTDTPQTQGAAPKPSRFMALVVPQDTRAVVAADDGDREVGAGELAGDYSWAKEYAYELTRKDAPETDFTRAAVATAKNSYVIRFTPGAALYCDINATLELRKRSEGKAGQGAPQFARPSKVVIRKRDAGGAELEEADGRRKRALLPVGADGFGAGAGGDE